MLKLEDLRPAPGSRHHKKRLGRGTGSGHGKTSGRGGKGQTARSGYQMPPGFEGGQTPIWRRVPKRGFNHPSRREYAIVNLETLEARYEEGAEVTPDDLLERGIIKKLLTGVKILGRGELTKRLVVKADRFSQSALEKITAAGGEAIALAPPPSLEEAEEASEKSSKKPGEPEES
jgi:large subunit ribosomal protein L15